MDRAHMRSLEGLRAEKKNRLFYKNMMMIGNEEWRDEGSHCSQLA